MTADRPTLSLDGSWRFVPDPGALLAPDRLPPGRPIRVPGAWEAQVEPPYGVVHAWCRRSFEVPDDWPSGTLLLRFGCAMAHARVWLDGRSIGEHADGYLPFELAAGSARRGATHDLVVRIDNPVNALTAFPGIDPAAIEAATVRAGGESFEAIPHGKQAWYTSTSGLLGSVTAACVPDPWLAMLRVQPNPASGTIEVRWRLGGERPGRSGRVRVSITAPDATTVAATLVEAHAGRARLAIPDAVPWEPSRPALYGLEARLELDGDGAPGGDAGIGAAELRVDTRRLRFGMRTIEVRDGSILLNGRSVYVRGALDQDLWPEGLSNPPSRSALEAQFERARELGLNLLRCHVKVPDPAYLDVADETGMLAWCELPSWRRFGPGTADAARRLLRGMVETMGHHPSLIAWTVINEDWGTDLRHSARDRRWLRATVDSLRADDPGRLVVDNSACGTSDGPNFHVSTDLLDYHAYRSMPDGLPRWRALIGDLARRPGWLWSPHGDATATGHEVLLLSEFGTWGLPRPSAALAGGRAPWWMRTGGAVGPAGLDGRFAEQALDRIWPDPDALADATQWRQLEGLADQVREIRRHPAIRGFVVTELADTAWEANGLLDFRRGRKVFHDRVAEVTGPDVLVVDPVPGDLWAGERHAWDVMLASSADAPSPARDGGGRLDWELRLDDRRILQGSDRFDRWISDGVVAVGRIEADLPDVPEVTPGELSVTATADAATGRSVFREPVLVVPRSALRSTTPRRIAVVEPPGLWSIAQRLERLGHEAVVAADRAELIVAAQLDAGLLEAVDAGASLLLLARSDDAIEPGLVLETPLAVRNRWPGDEATAAEREREGDWISVFAWALPGVVPGLDAGGLLGRVQAEVFPDHVLVGDGPANGADTADAGLFAGWLHGPAALLVSRRHGRGRLTATTLRVAPEDGPVATVLLESLVQRAARASGAIRNGSDRPQRTHPRREEVDR